MTDMRKYSLRHVWVTWASETGSPVNEVWPDSEKFTQTDMTVNHPSQATSSSDHKSRLPNILRFYKRLKFKEAFDHFLCHEWGINMACIILFGSFACWDFTKSLPQKRLEVSGGHTQVPMSDAERAWQRAELLGFACRLRHVLSTDLRKGPPYLCLAVLLIHKMRQ